MFESFKRLFRRKPKEVVVTRRVVESRKVSVPNSDWPKNIDTEAYQSTNWGGGVFSDSMNNSSCDSATSDSSGCSSSSFD